MEGGFIIWSCRRACWRLAKEESARSEEGEHKATPSPCLSLASRRWALVADYLETKEFSRAFVSTWLALWCVTGLCLSVCTPNNLYVCMYLWLREKEDWLVENWNKMFMSVKFSVFHWKIILFTQSLSLQCFIAQLKEQMWRRLSRSTNEFPH